MIPHAFLLAVVAVSDANTAPPVPSLLPIESALLPIEPIAPLRAPAFRPAPAGGKNGFSYTFAEANYLWRDSNAADESLDGVEVRGSFEIFFNLFLQASYAKLSSSVDLDEYTAGLGYHLPIGDKLDLYGILSYANEDFSGNGISGADADGAMLAAGARFWLTEKLELNGELQWADIEESAGGFALGARWYLIDLLSLGATGRRFDNDNSFSVGARVQF